MGMDPEAELLERCRRGEADAWDQLFNLHYDATARFIFQLSSEFTREDAQEICQETFLAVIKNMSSFSGQSQFRTWLFKIASNKARDYRERQHAAKRGGGQTPISLQAENSETGLSIDPASSAPGPDLSLIHMEQAELVGEALHRVGEPCREIIELRYFGDLSYDEIAKCLDLNHKTVSSRLSKCLDKLEEITRSLIAGEQTALFPSNM